MTSTTASKPADRHTQVTREAPFATAKAAANVRRFPPVGMRHLLDGGERRGVGRGASLEPAPSDAPEIGGAE